MSFMVKCLLHSALELIVIAHLLVRLLPHMGLTHSSLSLNSVPTARMCLLHADSEIIEPLPDESLDLHSELEM